MKALHVTSAPMAFLRLFFIYKYCDGCSIKVNIMLAVVDGGRRNRNELLKALGDREETDEEYHMISYDRKPGDLFRASQLYVRFIYYEFV